MTDLPTPFDALLDHTALLAMWGALLLHWFFPVPADISRLLSGDVSLMPSQPKSITSKTTHSNRNSPAF